jgi:5-methylcytosine-specific restriction endonuclease McrA
MALTHAEKNRRYRQRHPERVAAYQKKWHAEHPGYGAAQAREWQEANRDRYEERQRTYGAAHPGRSTANVRRWRERHPEEDRLTGRLQASKRRALLAGVTIVEISTDQLLAKWTYWGGQCWMCGDEATAWDHVKPLVAGGLHCLANLRPACTPCNSRKGGRWPFPLKGPDDD